MGETEFVVAADPAGFVRGIVGFADLTRPEVGDVLAAHIEAGAGRFRGVRHATAWDASPDVRRARTDPGPALLARPDYRAGVAAVAHAGLSLDVWVYHPQLWEVAALARDFPGLTIVIDHLGGPLGTGPYEARREGVRALWSRSMSELARCPNVRVKLGGVGMAVLGTKWRPLGRQAAAADVGRAWRADIRWCIETFGPERCMFESNFPVDRDACSYGDLWEAFADMVADAGPTERAALFHDTAVSTYRLAVSTDPSAPPC